MSRIQYDALSVRNSDRVKASAKGSLNIQCSEEDHEGFHCNNNPKCTNCGQPHMASSKDCQYFLKEKEIQKVKSEKKYIVP